MPESLQHTALDAKHEKKRSQKIFDISAKVAKQLCKGHDEEDRDYIHYGSDNHNKHSTETLRCFHCNKIGHIKANCLERKGKVDAKKCTTREDDDWSLLEYLCNRLYRLWYCISQNVENYVEQ